MSQENSSILRFSLEESVWFQKGQEVDDLLSISLDPNITIQENDQYITIQGSLELTGEYNRTQNIQSEEEEFKAPKLVHSVLEREEGVYEFLHHFPIDITIPFSRVQSVDDIEVEIETFDYVFPERSCLNLTAELSIAGLTNEEQVSVEEDNDDQWPAFYSERDEEAERADVTNTQSVYEFVEQEDELEALTRGYGHRQPDEEEEIEITASSSTEEVSFGDPDEEIEAASYRETTDEEAERVEIEVQPFQRISPLMEEDERVSADSGLEEYEPFELEVRKAPPEKEDDWEEDDISQVPLFTEADVQEEPPPFQAAPVADTRQELKVSLFRAEEETFPAEDVFDKPVPESSELKLDESTAEYAEKEESSSENDHGTKKKKGLFAKKKSLTFTEFFARKEEETHTKVKVCIVQQGDTIEKLSERYNVNVHTLLKENHLEVNQDVAEGQVLYIPIKLAEK
ncbi:LysM peptidoglycan-binding domain-containing protein [Niallia circulans]|uniref:LysM peptidoglycan-binding domain-containing protein n=1 Tax=Niallia circulans TaxID=1397 RepID=A0A553SK72_NIACI|nr:LysM peptidoglycan-binding domain-containing protein [Niallia circulans]TRZ37398.1 LysM peptidoglycan-binding domain-containing protein [Niallia circulans]